MTQVVTVNVDIKIIKKIHHIQLFWRLMYV